MNELSTHLQDLVDKAKWDWLEEHVQEGRLLVVVPKLGLVEVGLALAEDDISIVKKWLDDGWIHRPSPEQITYWSEHDDLEFESLIIQPFVLCREPLVS